MLVLRSLIFAGLDEESSGVSCKTMLVMIAVEHEEPVDTMPLKTVTSEIVRLIQKQFLYVMKMTEK